MTTCAVKQVIPVIGSETRKDAASGRIKTACDSLFTQNWHCRVTTLSMPVIGIELVGVALLNVLVGNVETVGRMVPTGGGDACAGRLQAELSRITNNVPMMSRREKAFPKLRKSFLILSVFPRLVI